MLGLDEWFYNFSQFIFDLSTPENLALIKAPYTEMHIYGTFKCAEIGSVIGGLIAHPIYRFYLWNKVSPGTMTSNTGKVIRNKCRKLQGRFLLGGLFMGPIMTLAYQNITQITEKEAKEFCYKVRCDSHGLVQDRSAFAFGLIGWYWKRFQGAVDGVNLGLFYSLIHKYLIAEHGTPLFKDNVLPDQRLPSVEDLEKRSSKFKKFILENEHWKDLK
ncbi:Protein of unknown function DUF1757 family-containing protein [Strongyloides ratti]|uniref:Uncharacterized protein n=1 Tax=Strongyloides ratti TaxID=34506 RepID=A0A090KZI7_STRRB|nr:Protein of unknown function DUF1757 family-containing protein [Strongyloides ratti]CEF61257.1 Protein of unknown function DUF1757 family-containing protein [Strongyloides ratti]